MTKIVIYSRDASIYEECFAQQLNHAVELSYAGINPSAAVLKKADILLGEPDLISEIIADYANVKWVQSAWAGNNKMQNNPYQHYLLTGVKGIFAQQMTEYTLAYMLYFQRNIEQFNSLKNDKKWQQLPNTTIAGKTLGILGIGNIGQSVAKNLAHLGIRTIGLSQSGNAIAGINVYQPSQLSEFAEQCDFILNLLPETEETKGLCNLAFFNNMRKGSIFINAGRGSVIDKPESLIQVLKSQHLLAAIVDVFEEEPLPCEHPYYDVPNLHITCHTAAVSDPKLVFEVFWENLGLFLARKPLLYQHDFNKGY